MTDVNLDGGEMMICIIGVASSIGIVSTFICVLLAFVRSSTRVYVSYRSKEWLE